MQTKSTGKKRRRWLWAALPVAIAIIFFGLNALLQTFWAHRDPYFSPDYAQIDLSPILEQDSLDDEDYETIFFQTGLARPAVDALLSQGSQGVDQILETQAGFFTEQTPVCLDLPPITKEDRLRDADGNPVYSVPLTPLEPGDIILSFSTHTYGWRHGHASLVVDPQLGVTLEAVVLGSDSAQVNAQHWRTYSNFMVLRVKDADDETRQQVVRFALEHLDGIPYSLLSGIFGPKAPDPDSSLKAQCAYLPWYAWQAFGVDLDSDGGKIVTVLDLAESPLLEVVQIYGIDPASLPLYI